VNEKKAKVGHVDTALYVPGNSISTDWYLHQSNFVQIEDPKLSSWHRNCFPLVGPFSSVVSTFSIWP